MIRFSRYCQPRCIALATLLTLSLAVAGSGHAQDTGDVRVRGVDQRETLEQSRQARVRRPAVQFRDSSDRGRLAGGAAGVGAMSVAPPRRTLSRIGGKHFIRVTGGDSTSGDARGAPRRTFGASGATESRSPGVRSFRIDRVGAAGSARVD
jgi:hypothetical protein